MDDAFEKLLLNLRGIWPQGNWDWANRENLISKYVDPRGGVWDCGPEKSAPCGCKFEAESNSQRNWLYCPAHKESGVLVISLGTNQIYWLTLK